VSFALNIVFQVHALTIECAEAAQDKIEAERALFDARHQLEHQQRDSEERAKESEAREESFHVDVEGLRDTVSGNPRCARPRMSPHINTHTHNHTHTHTHTHTPSKHSILTLQSPPIAQVQQLRAEVTDRDARITELVAALDIAVAAREQSRAAQRRSVLEDDSVRSPTTTCKL
jgi:hypothetical protein